MHRRTYEPIVGHPLAVAALRLAIARSPAQPRGAGGGGGAGSGGPVHKGGELVDDGEPRCPVLTAAARFVTAEVRARIFSTQPRRRHHGALASRELVERSAPRRPREALATESGEQPQATAALPSGGGGGGGQGARCRRVSRPHGTMMPVTLIMVGGGGGGGGGQVPLATERGRVSGGQAVLRAALGAERA